MESSLFKRKRALFSVLDVLKLFIPLLLLMFIAPSFSSSRRSELLVSMDVAYNVSSELSALAARELAVDASDDIFALPLFRDLSLPTRSVRFFVNAFSVDRSYFSEERIVLREKAPNVDHLARLFQSEAPLLLPTLLWVRAKMVGKHIILNDDNKFSFSQLHASICAYDHPVRVWPTLEDLGTAYNHSINVFVYWRLKSVRTYLCGIKPIRFKSEFKKLQRYIMFKTNKQLKKIPSTLQTFLEEISSMIESINDFFAHFKEKADRVTSWPLFKRIYQPELDFRLFPVFSKMMQIDNPKSLSEVSLTLLQSCLEELKDDVPEVMQIVNTLDAVRECNDNTDKTNWEKIHAFWPWLAERSLFEFNASCPKGNYMKAMTRSIVDILLYTLAKQSPDTVGVLLQMTSSHVSTSTMSSNSSLFPLSLLLGDDFTAYEFFLTIHSSRRYLDLISHPSLWSKVLCSPKQLRQLFGLLPEINVKFLSVLIAFLIRRLVFIYIMAV